MLRESKIPLKVKENESGCAEEKEEASFPLSKDQKSCKVTKPKAIRPSKKENVTDGNQTRPQKRALKCPKGPEEDLCQPRGVDGSWQLPGSRFGALRGDGLREPPLPLETKEDFSSSPAVPLGNDFYCTPERDKVEGKADFGLSEQRKKPEFAAVGIAEFGVAQEGFTQRPPGTSPTSLKFRRRSTIGLRGSPENNTLIRFLAQHRSSRQKEPFTQISPFTHANVRSLKDKIDAFQTSFESLQEAEAEPELSHLGEASQEGGASQNKAPFKKEPNLEQWSEKFTLGKRGAAWKENEWLYEQQNPVKPLETVVPGNILETGHVRRCEHGPAGSSSPGDVGAVEGQSPAVLGGNQAPVTPPRPGNGPGSDPALLRSILKKTPLRELRASPQEYSNSAIDRGVGESPAVSNCVKAFEPLQTETTESQSSKTPKKKKVTFGEVLSPEIFDQSLPANTPLRRGASPGQSPWERPGPSAEPLPLLDFGWDDECVEPLQEFVESSVGAEAPSPVENAEVAETGKPDITTHSSAKRKDGAGAEDSECSSSGATDTRGEENSLNPRRNKAQRQKNPTTAAPRKTQKTKYPSYGKRRKKKAKKSLYGEREMASKKPLLSPIPEIPEVFSSVSYPNSPKADELFTGGADLGSPSSRNAMDGGSRGQELCAAALRPGPEAAATSSAPGDSEGPGSLGSAPGPAPELSNILPEGGFDTSEYFQQGEETPREKESKESSSLIEKEELQGSLLTGLEILAQQDVQGGAQRTECPQKDSGRGEPARRRRRRSSSAFYFPPAANSEITGPDAAVSSYSVEEVLAAPGAGEGPRQPRGRRSRASTEGGRVRRSMRLSRDAASEGLAWIQLPGDIPGPAPAAKARSSIGTSVLVLAGAENVHPREQNLLPLPALGKENEGFAPPAAAPGRRWRRRSLCEVTAPERPWAPAQRRRSTNCGCGKDSRNQKHLEEAETLELRLKDVAGISDFVK